MSMLLWTPRVTAEHLLILEQLADLGFDGVEVPITEGEDHDYAELHRMLEDLGLARTAVTFATASTNPISPDPAIRRATPLWAEPRIRDRSWGQSEPGPLR